MANPVQTEVKSAVNTVETDVKKIGNSYVTIKKYVLAAVGLGLLLLGTIVGCSLKK